MAGIHFVILVAAIVGILGTVCGQVEGLVSRGENCTLSPSSCVDGTVCAGSEFNMRCVKPMEVGDRCGVDPFWVCADGLVCESNTCKIPRGGRCTTAQSSCVDGTTCAGTETKKRCVKPMSVCGKCATDPFWVCRDGLVCESNVCKVPRGNTCTQYRNCCASGSTCAGTRGKMRCVKPMPVCGRCGVDPYWVCAEGLICEANVCKVPRGRNCTARGSCCESGTVCAGTETKKRCVKPMKAGGQCGVDPYWVCADGLICKSNVCVTSEQ